MILFKQLNRYFISRLFKFTTPDSHYKSEDPRYSAHAQKVTNRENHKKIVKDHNVDWFLHLLPLAYDTRFKFLWF